jgi:hypothetical protein
MSARAAVNAWGQWFGYCTKCTETIAGNRSKVHLWADVHNSDNHAEAAS